MSIQANIPEIIALRKEVENKFGAALHTHAHFVSLTEAIEATLHEHMSPTTLERVWGYSTRYYNTVSRRTLDVLARYAERENWDDFCAYLKLMEGTESDFFTDDILSTSSLAIGTRLRLGWQPDRVCEVRYMGDYRFVVESVTNGSLRIGDSFSCLQFQLGQLLYMDCFHRVDEASEENQRYAVGRENGLTLLEIV
ncbi:MAG: hypothetical protein IKT86_00265 [Bacteroidaceae bacterium]|nr:hypothetical protein [Bacteroidaceae bacterium]